MFSGFKSQWTMSTSCLVRKSSDFSSCRENFRIRFKDTPLNLCEGRQADSQSCKEGVINLRVDGQTDGSMDGI